MDKDKLIKGCMWICATALCILVTSQLLFIGFNNSRYGHYLFLILGFLFLPSIFYCAYKGFKLVLSSIFE